MSKGKLEAVGGPGGSGYQQELRTDFLEVASSPALAKEAALADGVAWSNYA